jgi:hypothetical protein
MDYSLPPIRGKELSNEMTYNFGSYLSNSKTDIIVPSFLYAGFEMDFLRYSPRFDCIYEYELKTSYNDFLNDFKKHKYMQGQQVKKHDLVMSGRSLTNRFFFVCPEGVIHRKEVPEMYGLIYYSIDKKKFSMIKNATYIKVPRNKYEIIAHIGVQASLRSVRLNEKLHRQTKYNNGTEYKKITKQDSVWHGL